MVQDGLEKVDDGMETKTPILNNEEDITSRALDQLARYLTVRDHSRFELTTKLSRKYPPEIVEQAVIKAEARGWLGDENAVTERAVQGWRAKLKSDQYIADQLRKRGLPPLPQDSDTEVDVARKLLLKKFGENLDFATTNKALGYLKNRGFEDRTIRMVLSGKEEY